MKHRKTGRKRPKRIKTRKRYTKKRGGSCSSDSVFKRVMENPHPL